MQGVVSRMFQSVRDLAALAGRAERKDQLSAALAALAVVVGSAAIASPQVRDRAWGEAAADAARLTGADAQADWRRVWIGEDVDGDGQADFINPTGGEVRGHDEYGFGQFGASRDGGSRRHEGVDFVAQAGQAVLAPISGYVTKIGLAYAGDTRLKFVEISNPALQYVGRVFYVDPSVVEGEPVRMGAKIGVSHSLQNKYANGMTDHVHLELMDRKGRRFDATQVLSARYERVQAQG